MGQDPQNRDQHRGNTESQCYQPPKIARFKTQLWGQDEVAGSKKEGEKRKGGNQRFPGFAHCSELGGKIAEIELIL
jgi:hypothetical protein